jgi:aryl-alcohol dehydrogenase-like predicted oxidoreductase
MKILPIYLGNRKAHSGSQGGILAARIEELTMSERYYTLGRSGLRVSRLALGTMTFGTDWGWGSEEKSARAIFDRYLEAGGNFIDTADVYTGGTSERLLGKFIQEARVRDRVVVTTKFTFNDSFGGNPADPNTGGNHRKNILRAVDGSLKRLGTDYIDLYLMHAWDRITPVEEVMRTFDDLVRAGKVRYVGFSNVPAWYAARAQTLAELRGWEPLAALQLEYSLVERNVEREFSTLAQQLGLGIMAWSPLASGLLSGKYRSGRDGVAGDGRLQVVKDTTNPAFMKFTERNWSIVAALDGVAQQCGRSMAQVALNWAAHRPGIASLIIGATKLDQLQDNLQALEFTLPPELRAQLDEISQPPRQYPYFFFENEMQGMIHGGAQVGDKPDEYRAAVRIKGAGSGVT